MTDSESDADDESGEIAVEPRPTPILAPVDPAIEAQLHPRIGLFPLLNLHDPFMSFVDSSEDGGSE